MANSIHTVRGLSDLMRSVLPETIPPQQPLRGKMEYPGVSTPEDFIRSFEVAAKKAPMAFRLSPHVLSVINWTDPLNDPVRRQFVPLDSVINVAHPAGIFDPLHEVDNSPVRGVIHRYSNKALFMGELAPRIPFPLQLTPVQRRQFARSIAVFVSAHTRLGRRRKRSRKCDFFP